jgi:hypothetical protein
MTWTQQLYDTLTPRSSDGREAFRIVDELFASIVAALRRHPRIAPVSRLELELLLADSRRDIERWLFTQLHDRIDLHDAIDVVARRFLGED